MSLSCHCLPAPKLHLSSDKPYLSPLPLPRSDVILPGLLAAFAARFDAAAGCAAWHRGYFAPVVGGYGVGLVLTYAALAFEIGGSQGQPALLYLVPCTLGTLALVACWRGQFWELWGATLEGGAERSGGSSAQAATAAAASMEAGLEGDERRTLLAGSPESPTAA